MIVELEEMGGALVKRCVGWSTGTLDSVTVRRCVGSGAFTVVVLDFVTIGICGRPSVVGFSVVANVVVKDFKL